MKHAFRKVIIILNFYRLVFAFLFLNIFKLRSDCIRDIEISTEHNGISRWDIYSMLIFNKCYRNIVCYRVRKKNSFCGFILKMLFWNKKDFEIAGNNIAPGIAVYHGHGTIINVEEAGPGLMVWQGVTLGKNEGSDEMPKLGKNVKIYANAVVVGNITIGDNVRIGAGAVVIKDVPSNSLVYGNPAVIKNDRR